MQPLPLRIAIAEDHIGVRQGIVSLLSQEDYFQIVLEADNGQQLLKELETIAVDVILLDLQMPIMDGTTALSKLTLLHPQIKVIVFTGMADASFGHEIIERGAKGFLMKNADINTIIKTICEIANISIEYRSKKKPSKREMQVLHYIIEARSTEEIAQLMSLSRRTIENHKYSLYQKTGTKDLQGLKSWLSRSNT